MANFRNKKIMLSGGPIRDLGLIEDAGGKTYPLVLGDFKPLQVQGEKIL